MSFNLKASQVLEAVKKQVSSANFRARNYGLADTFTVEQWLTILNEWGWKCAVCSVGTRDLSPDHWIPIASDECPGSTYENIVPLCEGCNLSKHDTEPKTWLTKRFGEEVAMEKLGTVRRVLGQLTTPGHPYNTTIPEDVWLGETKDESPKYGSVKIIFDFNIPGDVALWEMYEVWIESGVFQPFVKNILFAANFAPSDPEVFYKDWKPGGKS